MTTYEEVAGRLARLLADREPVRLLVQRRLVAERMAASSTTEAHTRLLDTFDRLLAGMPVGPAEMRLADRVWDEARSVASPSGEPARCVVRDVLYRADRL